MRPTVGDIFRPSGEYATRYPTGQRKSWRCASKLLAYRVGHGYTCRNSINAETLLFYKCPAASSKTCSITGLYGRKSLVIIQSK